jgi:hypothetical protein
MDVWSLLPQLKDKFNAQGELLNTNILRIQRLWEDENPCSNNLLVTEVGLLSVEK